MDSWDLRIFRNDLSIFLKLIDVDFRVPGDFSKLWSLKEKLYDNFNYNLVEPIVFKIEGISGCFPSNLNMHSIFFENAITIKKPLVKNEDCLLKYKFELNMISYVNGKEREFKTAWHHDKHDDSEETKYTHPTYHFHFGGRFLKGLDSGDLAILASPRIPHPPMDIFLGFHFIISNFFSLKDYPIIFNLTNSYDYKEIIKRAQKRLWTPYFKAFDSLNTHQDFTMSKLFPLYIN